MGLKKNPAVFWSVMNKASCRRPVVPNLFPHATLFLSLSKETTPDKVTYFLDISFNIQSVYRTDWRINPNNEFKAL